MNLSTANRFSSSVSMILVVVVLAMVVAIVSAGPSPSPCAVDTTSRSEYSPNSKVNSAGNFGIGPWGSGSRFADATAQWIWSSSGSQSSAPANVNVFFQKLYDSSSFCGPVTVHVIADDQATFKYDGSEIGSVVRNGWVTTAYTRFSLSMTKGFHLFEFVAMNTGGPAGLLVAVIRDSDGAVLFHSDVTWSTYIPPSPTRTPSGTPTPSSSLPACDVDSTVRSLKTPTTAVQVAGTFGMSPWGGGSYFADNTAQWIWNSANSHVSAAANFDVFFQYLYTSDPFCGPVTVHVICDDYASFYYDGALVGSVTQGGWTTTSYSRFSLTLSRGTHHFEFVARNGGGPAGLLVSVIRQRDNRVLFHTDGTWTTYIPSSPSVTPSRTPSKTVTPTKSPSVSLSPTASISHSPSSSPCLIDTTSRSLFVPNTAAIVAGNAGISPWGWDSSFPDSSAKWIWNTANANVNAPGGPDVYFQYLFNSVDVCGPLTVHFIVDDTGTFKYDGNLVGSSSLAGWGSGTYGRFTITMTRGLHLFEFSGWSGGGPAGLLVTVIRNSDGSVVFHSDSSWITYIPPSVTPTPSVTASRTSSVTSSVSVSTSSSQTSTVTTSNSASVTGSVTPSISLTSSQTATLTASLTSSISQSQTPTISLSSSRTAAVTPSPTPSISVTPSPGPAILFRYRSITTSISTPTTAFFAAQSSTITSSNPTSFTNTGPAGTGGHTASLRFSFVVSSNAGSKWQFQVGTDAGYGGTLYLDGVLLYSTSSSLWWDGQWNNISNLIRAENVNVTNGAHVFEAVWAEDCCNGAGSARFRVSDTAGWLEVASVNRSL